MQLAAPAHTWDESRQQQHKTVHSTCFLGLPSSRHPMDRCDGAARNFKLLDELESAEKSSKGGADISLGLARPDDTYMSGTAASRLMVRL